MTDTKTDNKKIAKPWHKRKRVWGIVILILLAYFCLVPSRTRISPETTGITEPLTADGRVDYFAAFEKLYIDKLSPPEDNGQRYIIAAFGPVVLEQMALADKVPWEEMPTHEYSKNWFETRWIPLCEHLYIDPYERPMFYDLHGFYGYMWQIKKKEIAELGEENYIDDDSSSEKLWNRLTSAPWKVEDEPVVARWVEEYSPVLDYFGQCVRMPNYTCYRWRADNMFWILLPDVQAHRDFGRSLKVRIAERVGRGDLDGAWYDVMSMKHIASHYKNEPFFVTNLVGIANESMANDSAQMLLDKGNPTPEQLERFLKELNDLPRPNPSSFSMTFERMASYELVQLFKAGHAPKYYDDMKHGGGDTYKALQPIMSLLYLPFDANIAGERLTELFGEFGLRDFSDFHQGSNPILQRQYVEQMEEKLEQLQKKLQKTSQWSRVPLIRTRSRLLAEYIFNYTSPAFGAAFEAFSRKDTENEMLKIAIALEHYKKVNGEYPAKLDALVPTYFPMVPLDPFTGRKTITYKITPDGKHPFVLYSYGPNAKDDNGRSEFAAGKTGGDDYINHDIVFWFEWE